MAETLTAEIRKTLFELCKLHLCSAVHIYIYIRFAVVGGRQRKNEKWRNRSKKAKSAV